MSQSAPISWDVEISRNDWEVDLKCWLAPFLDELERRLQKWAPLYVKGLLLPGERKSVEPMAARVAPGDRDQLHHFVAISPWRAAPLEAILQKKVDELVGGDDAVLIIDDTSFIKKGTHSV